MTAPSATLESVTRSIAARMRSEHVGDQSRAWFSEGNIQIAGRLAESAITAIGDPTEEDAYAALQAASLKTGVAPQNISPRAIIKAYFDLVLGK